MEFINAFIVGGAICVIGQLLIDFTKLTPARILVIFVTAGVFLTAIGIYEPLVEFAGSGAAVPLSGFGYSLANGVKEMIAEKGFLGIFCGGLSACSYGIAAVIFFALLASFFSKSKDKCR